MSSSASAHRPQQDKIQLDRKALKKPDAFLSASRRFFDGVFSGSQGAKALVLPVALLLGASAAWGLYQNYSKKNSGKALDALYLARKTAEKELAAVAATLEPLPGSVKPASAAPKKSDDKATKAGMPVEAAAYAKLDVDAKLPESKKAFEEILRTYPSTRAAFEAKLALADLYYQHGQPERSLSWYQEAVEKAPGTLEKALALYALGYAQEDAGRPDDALKSYERALGLGDAGLKGELLFGLARSQEASGKVEDARKTYDRVVTELAGSDYATQAQARKADLK